MPAACHPKLLIIRALILSLVRRKDPIVLLELSPSSNRTETSAGSACCRGSSMRVASHLLPLPIWNCMMHLFVVLQPMIQGPCVHKDMEDPDISKLSFPPQSPRSWFLFFPPPPSLMPSPLKAIRRLVTGHTHTGKSTFIIDDNLVSFAWRGNERRRATRLWVSEHSPADTNNLR